ncbi:hypothetical protein GCM10010470_32740 [Saccharopolyspora taberi]|uniref:Crp/Fnr family transcriptional regulator n=1 Tax=Saccharopolyspora taberi TaxID=60895 RepID=A0ABN3VDS0_9PSEU
MLLNGCVKVTATTAEGNLALLAIRIGGEVIGELASLDQQPRSATITTAGRLAARVIQQSDFHAFLAAHPDAALAISRSVGGKLRWSTRRRIDFSGCETRVRIARVLVELSTTYGQQTPEGLTLGVALTQPELAALVGAAEPTVHKIFAELRRLQVITTGYRRTVIRDQRALQLIAGLGSP